MKTYSETDISELLRKRIWTAAELAAVLGVTEQTIRNHEKTGVIPSVRIGRTIRFERAKMVQIYGSICGGTNEGNAVGAERNSSLAGTATA